MIQRTVAKSKKTSLLSLSINCKTVHQLKQLHAHLLKTNQPRNPFAIATLLNAAATSNDASFFSYARWIFDRLCHRNTFIYNSMIRGYMRMNLPSDAVFCYLDMLNCGFEANNYTFPPLIKACKVLVSSASLFYVKNSIGYLVHDHAVKFGFGCDPFVLSALIELYFSVREIETARKLFDSSSERDVVVWTAMVDGYGKVGNVESARKLFEEMPERNTISWSAMMAAYSRVSNFNEVLCLFRRMQEVGTRPNESVLVSVLTACAHLGTVTQGLWIHSYAKWNRLDSNPILATALVNMYSKCGYVESACAVFDGIYDKDAGAWNAMISGVAMNGDARKSFELFNQMIASGTQPTETTFVALITGCTHASMVKEGVQLFEEMGSVYGVEPKLEHYACVVDLLSRAGMVDEAEKFIEENIGGLEGGDANVWGALLGACRIYGNVESGNRIWKKLADMGIADCGTHLLSYKIYREAGWDTEAKRLRKLISEFGMKKKPGCSVIEVNGAVEEFLAGDFYHPQAPEMYKMLDSFSKIVNLEELAVLYNICSQNILNV